MVNNGISSYLGAKLRDWAGRQAWTSYSYWVLVYLLLVCQMSDEEVEQRQEEILVHSPIRC